MTSAFEPAIAALERKLEDLERKANELRGAINVLCEEAGQPPRYPDGGSSRLGAEKNAASLSQIGNDTFYGKKQTTAIREYLEMRRSHSLGPAKPREILEALKQGNYQFETKDDESALAVLRNLMRKNNTVFHRLPTGVYGLAAWYPDAKKPKDNDDEQEEAAAKPKPAAASRSRKPRAKASKAKRGPVQKPPERKEAPHVEHEPDITGPVTEPEAA